MSVRSAAEFVEGLASRGRYSFSLDDADRALPSSATAVRAALRRLKEKGRLAEPARGFFVIVPPEYRRLRCLPADQFVPQLLEYWNEPYYVALLSAAELHGAGHQRPQVYQVMLERNRRPLRCGDIRIEFVARHDMAATPTISKKTARGFLRVASPAATAFELVGYLDRCGGLDNVATILVELADQLKVPQLVAEAQRAPTSWSQRLGYLLETQGKEKLAAALEPFVHRISDDSALVRSLPRVGAPRNRRWKLVLNATVEPDL